MIKNRIVPNISTSDISDNKPVTITLAHLKDQKRDLHRAPLPWRPYDERITTSYYPFNATLKPLSGPPGNCDIQLQVQCPICNKQIELKCFQQTVLFTKPNDFKSEAGKVLKRLLFFNIMFLPDLIGKWVIFSIISIIPSALMPGVFFKPGTDAFKIGMFITFLLFILFLFVILQGYQYIMLSMRNSLVSIRKPHLFRAEFHDAFNIFTEISIPKASLPLLYASEHFILPPVNTHRFTSRDLLGFYGFIPCNLYL